MPTETHKVLKIGSKNLTIYKFTGKVAEAQKHLETQVSGGGGGGGSYRGTGGTAPVTITSRTITHDSLFLVDQEGKERALQLQGFNIACRPTNIVTALWAIPQGKERGHYYAIMNHSTDTQFINDKIIRDTVIECTNPLGNKLVGCLGMVIVLGICFAFPILFLPYIGYLIYYFMTVKKNVALIKANSHIPDVEPW